MEELNSARRIEIRHLHNRLKDTSNGIVILGIWTTLKSFLLSDSDQGTAAIAATAVVFLIVLLIDFRFRLVIWRGARKEAYGRDTNNRYLVFSFILIFFSVVSILMFIYQLVTDRMDADTGFASFLIEITSLCILCELVHSGIKLRRIRAGRIEYESDDADAGEVS